MSDHCLVVGEALIDVVVRADGSTSERPGGSPANVAVGLARLGRQTELLAWIGLDDHGRTIREHLEDSGVELVRGSESAIHTPVATAVLDGKGDADYSFDFAWAVSPNAAPTRKPSVVHTGSLGAVFPPGGAEVRALLEKYRSTATITYDPNVRPALMGNPVTASAQVDAVVAVSDIVKASDDDLAWLSPDESVSEHAARWLASGPSVVVVTKGARGATGFLRDGRRIDVSAPTITPVDTVGAGDAFMAGLIDGLWSQGYIGASTRDDLVEISTDVVNYVLTRCVGIAAVTISREGADPPTRAELGEGELGAELL